ncbi:hypothetical protein RIU96_10565 [Corynebacterium sp. Z-1]|uniref:hypothetical protein n=1 Tax=Corynebacterium sp. Z-1 TaxID=3074378 RepID=UPI00288354B2|nr:hypothetical protein [Corynebacterium sp. Z-1]WNI12640.1 hypothetical protein RIU96_10565 [Corynebacterium sp. Z-1]
MNTALTESDELLVELTLLQLNGVGVRPASEVKADDIEDAVLDELGSFRIRPLATLIGLRDPEDTPLFDNVWCDTCAEPRTTLAQLETCAEQLCSAAGTQLVECVAFADPGSDNSGSVRLRVGQWDVVDMDYDLTNESPELDLIAAIVPSGVTAVTFDHDDLDAHSVTVFLRSGEEAANVTSSLEGELSGVGASSQGQ